MSWKQKIFGGGEAQTEELIIPGMPQDLARVIARLQGQDPSNDDRLQIAQGLTIADILPISAELLAKPPEPRKPLVDPRQLTTGQMVNGKGIYLGIWEPRDRDGKSLSKIFDMYAAPTDLQDARGRRVLLTFNEAVKRVAALKNWHGHDGANMMNDTAVFEAIRQGREKELEKWFIPTRDLLHGKDVDGQKKITIDNLYDNKVTGEFNGTFVMQAGSGNAHWYWSCTEHRGNPSYVWGVRFSGGGDDWHGKLNFELSTRPVRAELRL